MFGQTPSQVIIDPELSPFYHHDLATYEVVPKVFTSNSVHYNGFLQDLLSDIRASRKKRVDARRRRKKGGRAYRRGLLDAGFESRQERLARRQERKLAKIAAKSEAPNGQYLYDDGGMVGEEDMYYEEEYYPAEQYQAGPVGPSPLMLAGGAALLLGGLWYMKNK